MKKRWILAVSLMVILIFQPENGVTQSLTGTTGLVTIPTAEMPEDGEISFGLSWLNREYFVYGPEQYHGVYHGMANFISLGYLPFLEISPRLTRGLNFPKPQAIGDRMVSIRLRLFEENAFFPSVVLGVHDPIGTKRFNASYLVASKSFRLSNYRMALHLGYGTDWIEAEWHQFVGLFGGISLSPIPSIALMLEHDAEKFNCGMRVSVLDHVEILLALLNFDAFSGGASYKFRL